MKRKVSSMAIMALLLCILTLILPACASEHVHNTTVTPPTCTERGYTTHSCSCGESIVYDYKDALQHDFSNYVFNDDATCTENGTETATCSRQGCHETDTREKTDTKKGHKFVNGICSVCGYDPLAELNLICIETDKLAEYGFILNKDADERILNAFNKVISETDFYAIFQRSFTQDVKPNVNLEDNTAGILNAYTNCFEPFVYRDENGELTGVDIYYLQLVAEELNMQLYIQEVPFYILVQSVGENSNSVGVSAITITDSRREIVDFSDSYYQEKAYIICDENSTYSHLDELEGLRIGVVIDDLAVGFGWSVEWNWEECYVAYNDYNYMITRIGTDIDVAVISDYLYYKLDLG